jgi:methionine aminotransferase
MSKLQILARVFYRNVKMAAEHDAINLAGIPNFPVDTVLTDIVIRLAKNNVHQYLPMAGYPPLLSNIALLVKNPTEDLLPEIEILVTAGATQAIFTTIQALVKANDEVIILDPSY